MDISIVGTDSIKLKGKHATFIVDPSKQMPKTTADAVIILDKENKNADVSRVTDYRIIIDGPGEYEIGGCKLSGMRTSKGTLYKLLIDDVNIALGFTTEAKVEDFNVCQIAVVNTNSDFSESFITALEPKITVLYGAGKTEAGKILGAENTTSAPKVSLTKDKLPEKMEVITLN